MRSMKKLLLILAAGLMALGYGCGSKGPLYLPDQPPGNTVPTQK